MSQDANPIARQLEQEFALQEWQVLPCYLQKLLIGQAAVSSNFFLTNQTA